MTVPFIKLVTSLPFSPGKRLTDFFSTKLTFQEYFIILTSLKSLVGQEFVDHFNPVTHSDLVPTDDWKLRSEKVTFPTTKFQS